MIFLHCFRLGRLRKSTEMDCKMEFVEIGGFLECTEEKKNYGIFLLWCNVSILTHVRADKQKALPKSCRRPAYSDAITVWRQNYTNLLVQLCINEKRPSGTVFTLHCTLHYTHTHTRSTHTHTTHTCTHTHTQTTHTHKMT